MVPITHARKYDDLDEKLIMQPIHNCHVHIFTLNAVPDRFLPFGLMKLARTTFGGKFLAFILQNLLPFSQNDQLDRVGAFLNIGHLDSQAEIFDYVRKFYPGDTQFIVLPLDLEYMGAGISPQSYPSQLQELRLLRRQQPDKIRPFVCADPRRPDVFDLVREYIEVHHFCGIKLYPSLGFFPFDPALRDIYAYAQDRQIPIISHCAKGGIHFQGEVTEEMKTHPMTGQKLPYFNQRHFSYFFSHPRNYEWVLPDFPDLKLCLAHFGGGREWVSYLERPWPDPDTRESWLSIISDYIRQYPHVFADISFTAYDRRLWPMIKVLMNTPTLQDRIIYGSDYYMVRTAVSEREFSINLRAAVGESEYNKMARTNSAAFLGQPHP